MCHPYLTEQSVRPGRPRPRDAPQGRARTARPRPCANGGDDDYGVGVGVATGSGRPGVPRMRTRSARSVGSAGFALSYRPVTWTWRAGVCVQFTALAARVTEPDMTFVDGERVTLTTSPRQYGLCALPRRAGLSVTPPLHTLAT